MNKDDTINLAKARRAAERIQDPEERLTRIREINEAETLRGLRKM